MNLFVNFKKNILYVWITINVICKEEKMTKKSRKKWPRFATQNCQQSESTHQVIRFSKLRLQKLSTLTSYFEDTTPRTTIYLTEMKSL